MGSIFLQIKDFRPGDKSILGHFSAPSAPAALRLRRHPGARFRFGAAAPAAITVAMSTAPPLPLDQPVTVLRGIGPERAAQLARLDIRTIGDLLRHRPRRYEDRRHFRAIADLRAGDTAAVRGTVVAQGLKRWKHGTRSVFELILSDGSGRLHCRWWNLPFMENYFAVGNEVFAYGRLVSPKPPTMDHPETEVIEAGEESSVHLNRIAPVYPLTEGLPQRWLRAAVWRALEQFASAITEPWPALALPDLPTRANAVHMLHFPEEMADAEIARQRLALDEFIALQLAIQRRRKNLEAHARGLPCGGNNRLMKPFLAGLGFKLTAAQTRVLREIRADLAGPHPMRRLLQSDVGSGKTVVAACAALMALESGFNVALMAPTEILAEQHFQNFSRWFPPLGVPVELRTGSRKSGEDGGWRMEDGKHARSSILDSPSALFVGTHALLTAGFDLPRLGLVVIDEQHKFGVSQREQLVRKGHYPHLLVMTATPIPRTLGLTLYGDLDVAVIDELPAGRGRVKTFVRTADALPKVWEFVRQKLAAGRQAYIVYPRVEGGDLTAGVKAVLQEVERLRATLAPHRVGLLHGRMATAEKDAVMAEFRANRLSALVATSVIEVGVDVPNATVMVIENAEDFGLAQLHQLRGRIGRGAHDAFCILVAAAKTPEARKRLNVLAETTDGFRIAEADLKLRGPGELLGQEQSGVPRFRFGDLAADLALVERARTLAAQLLSAG
jgi:ATP-dependent DNA helicase RecG